MSGVPSPRLTKAETAQPIEPLDDDPLKTRCRGHGDVSARRRHLRGMDRGALVHRENAEGLHSLRTVQHLANDARALISGLETVAAQARHMQEHIGGTIIGNDEAEALGDIEPFDGA